MKYLLALAFLSLLAPASFGQTQVLPPNRGYHVTSYKLTMDWRSVFQLKNAKFRGSNEITLETDTGLNVIALDASHMAIDSILIDHVRLGVTPQPVNDTLRIALSDFVPAGSTIIVTIYYLHGAANEQGLYFYPKHTFVAFNQPTADSIFTTQDLAYTMSEPLDAHQW